MLGHAYKRTDRFLIATRLRSFQANQLSIDMTKLCGNSLHTIRKIVFLPFCQR